MFWLSNKWYRKGISKDDQIFTVVSGNFDPSALGMCKILKALRLSYAIFFSSSYNIILLWLGSMKYLNLLLCEATSHFILNPSWLNFFFRQIIIIWRWGYGTFGVLGLLPPSHFLFPDLGKWENLYPFRVSAFLVNFHCFKFRESLFWAIQPSAY